MTAKSVRKKSVVTRPSRPPAAKKSVRKKKAARPEQAVDTVVRDIVVAALDDMKAQNIKVIDVARLTTITDLMVIASGTSDRHVRSIANNVVVKAKEAGHRPMGVEGEGDGEWVLVDLPGILVHIMLPRVREFYGLEKLWDVA